MQLQMNQSIIIQVLVVLCGVVDGFHGSENSVCMRVCVCVNVIRLDCKLHERTCRCRFNGSMFPLVTLTPQCTSQIPLEVNSRGNIVPHNASVGSLPDSKKLHSRFRMKFSTNNDLLAGGDRGFVVVIVGDCCALTPLRVVPGDFGCCNILGSSGIFGLRV